MAFLRYLDIFRERASPCSLKITKIKGSDTKPVKKALDAALKKRRSKVPFAFCERQEEPLVEPSKKLGRENRQANRDNHGGRARPRSVPGRACQRVPQAAKATCGGPARSPGQKTPAVGESTTQMDLLLQFVKNTSPHRGPHGTCCFGGPHSSRRGWERRCGTLGQFGAYDLPFKKRETTLLGFFGGGKRSFEGNQERDKSGQNRPDV